MDSKISYACVHCGQRMGELYKKYSPSVLKLMHCSACDNVADKYIGYDNVTIMIDIILFKREAYRHILFNTSLKNNWKLAILLWLMKSYVKCMTVSPALESSSLVMEHKFYICSLITLFGSLSYVMIVVTGLKMYEHVTASRPGAKGFLVWKALVISNFGQFLMLPALIWYDVHKQVHFCSVLIYCLLSQTQALSVVCSMPRSFLLPLLATAITAETLMNSSETAHKILLE